MNRIRQNITHYALCLLGLLFFATPQAVFAADEGASFAQNIVWGILVTITGTFLRIAGIVFDYGINTFVIGFGELYTTSGVGFAVDNAWVTIRDFVNLFFIFGLVYIGIKLILDSNDSNTRRWLVNLVIAALLINFSLFITKFVVDFSNQLSYQIAQGAGWYNDANGVAQSEVKMANRILDYMGITEIFNLSGDTLNNASWGYIFGTAIFFTITAFILIAGGFLLIIRFAMLNLFLVMSPLMFISWVLPPLKDYMSEYWRNFLGRAFFAPVYFMFMYFSLEILKGFQTYIKGGLGNAGSNMAQTLAGENGRQVLTSTQSTMPFFFLICIFMVASLVIASKMGADFGDKAVGLGKSLSNKAGNYAKRGAIGSGKFAARTTGGVAARQVNDLSSNVRSRYDRLTVRAQNSTSRRGRVANRLLRGTDGVTQRALGAGENASVFGSETREQQQKRREGYRGRVNQTERENNRSGRIDDLIIGATSNDRTPAGITDRQTARNALGNQVRRMSNDEVLELARNNPELLNNPAFAAYLTDGHMAHLRGSGALTNGQFGELEAARDDGSVEDLNDTLNTTGASAQNLSDAMERMAQVVSSMSADRLGSTLQRQLSSGNLDQGMITNLTDTQLTALRDSGQFTPAQLSQIRNTRNAGLERIAERGTLGSAAPPMIGNPDYANYTAMQDRNRRKLFNNPQQAGRLPASVLARPETSQYLTPRIIEEFMANSPSQGDIQTVRAAILSHINNPETNQSVMTTWQDWSNNRIVGRQFALF
jgi:hypothetical protein